MSYVLVTRRIGLFWTVVGGLRSVVKSKITSSLKRKVFDTIKFVNKLHVSQRGIENTMLGISVRDIITNASVCVDLCQAFVRIQLKNVEAILENKAVPKTLIKTIKSTVPLQ